MVNTRSGGSKILSGSLSGARFMTASQSGDFTMSPESLDSMSTEELLELRNQVQEIIGRRSSRKSPERCPVCRGVGKVSGNIYCSCALGVDLHRVENRKVAAAE